MQHPSSSPPMGVRDIARYSNDSNFSDDDAGIFMTIDNESGTEFFAIEPPRGALTKDSSQNERQISVDPISLQGPATIRQASFRLVSSVLSSKGLGPNGPPASLPPPKLKFVSASLPSSTASSPDSMSFKKKKHKNHDQGVNKNNHARVQSVMDDTHLAMIEANTRKSKSLGEGRTSGPADDFDLWLEKSNQQNSRSDHRSNSNKTNSSNKFSGFSKPPLGPGNADRHNSIRKSKSKDPNDPEDKFKCGKLCLFLPRGKGKAVRSISSTSTSTSTISQVSCKTEPLAISRRVSLEKFECGSWTSSLENEEGESANLFFDLPMEMLRCSVSDMQSPVTAAFVFDNDDDNGSSKDKKQDKDVEMHAFLEAQC